jgi:hypothetical protein
MSPKLHRPPEEHEGVGGGSPTRERDAPAAGPVYPAGTGGGSAESMTAAFGHLADPSAQAEAEAALAEHESGIRERLKSMLAAGNAGDGPASPGAVDWSQLMQAAESIAATDVRRVKSQCAGRVSDEDFARLAGRYRDAARNEAAKLQIDLFEHMGNGLDLESEGKNTTAERDKSKGRPRRLV